MGVIYRITNVANDAFYIGSTSNPRRRRWEHWDALRKGVHHCEAMQRAWDEFGEDAFEFDILEEVNDADLLRIEETYLMKHAGSAECYNTALSAHQSPALLPRVRTKISATLRERYAADPENHPRRGLTHTEETKAVIREKVQAALARGGGGKFVPSEQTRLRMSLALRGNQNAKGHVRSEEHRRRLSEANKGNQNWLGKQHTEETKAKLSKRVVEVTTGKEFSSLTAVLDHYGFKMPTLQRALKSGKPIAKGEFKGLVFRYASLPPTP